MTHPTNPLPVIGNGQALTYDDFVFPGAVSGIGGGTTTLLYRNGAFLESRGSIAGTLTNCAGGPTPWGSWLTNEEVTIRDLEAPIDEAGAATDGRVVVLP